MKLLLGFFTLLIATIILNMGRQESTRSTSHESSAVAVSRNGNGGGDQLDHPHAAHSDSNGDEDRNKHQHTGPEIAMEQVRSDAARRRLAATLTPTDQVNGQQLISSPSPAAAAKRDQEIAALLSVLDNMDGQDATAPSSMMIVTVQTDGHDECKSSLGTHLLTKAYKNKVDYCNLHDCTVRYLLESWPPMQIMDQQQQQQPASPPHLLLHLLHSHPSAQWLLWLPPHAIFTNLSSSFPLHTYSSLGKHLVLLPTSSTMHEMSLESKMEKWDYTDPLMFLVQNSDWSKQFLAQWKARIIAMEATTRSASKQPQETLETPQNEHNKEEANNKGYFSGVGAALLDVLKSRRFDGMQAKVYLENGLYLHGHQESLVKRHDELSVIQNYKVLNIGGIGDDQDKRQLFTKHSQSRRRISSELTSWPFLVHFEGCNLCNAPSPDDIPDLCLSTFQRAFYYADNQLLALTGMQHHRLYSTLA